MSKPCKVILRRPLPDFEKAADIEPKNHVACLYLSACARRAGRKQESIDYAKRATTLSPAARIGAWLQLARAEKFARSFQRIAYRSRESRGHLSPDNAYMLTHRWLWLHQLESHGRRVSPLQHAARFAPRDFLVQSQLGYCLYATGQIGRRDFVS